jgi:hypothetical protein
MDIVETSTDWIEFDAETDEVPFLHMHDMIEVKHKDYNPHWKLVPLPAWSVDFDSSRYPVTAYRVIKKADASEIEQLREAMDVQSNAVNVLHQAETSELNHLRKTAQEAYVAKMTLNSEREANKILTDDIERLRKILSTVLEACEDVNSPDQKVRREITRTVGKVLKEKE